MRSGCASSAPHPFPNLPPDLIGAIAPHALKIPAPKGRNTRYPETATLHFRLNQDSCAIEFVLFPSGGVAQPKNTGVVVIPNRLEPSGCGHDWPYILGPPVDGDT